MSVLCRGSFRFWILQLLYALGDDVIPTPDSTRGHILKKQIFKLSNSFRGVKRSWVNRLRSRGSVANVFEAQVFALSEISVFLNFSISINLGFLLLHRNQLQTKLQPKLRTQTPAPSPAPTPAAVQYGALVVASVLWRFFAAVCRAKVLRLRRDDGSHV